MKALEAGANRLKLPSKCDFADALLEALAVIPQDTKKPWIKWAANIVYGFVEKWVHKNCPENDPYKGVPDRLRPDGTELPTTQ